MLDADDVCTVLTLFDEVVIGPTADLLEELEKHHLADEGEMEEGQNLEEGFEDLTSAHQKAVEKAIRAAVTKLVKGSKQVAAELRAIDDEILGEEDDEEPEDDEDDLEFEEDDDDV